MWSVSRLAGADEEGMLARLRALRSDLIDPAIARHRGRIVKRTGDGSIIEFRSVVDAVRCAINQLVTLWRAGPGYRRAALVGFSWRRGLRRFFRSAAVAERGQNGARLPQVALL
jgi:class 3 adenylate cyclase